MSAAAAWGELVALAEGERRLALDGRWDEVATASSERLSAALALGAPPAEARPHLERLAELQAQITAVTATARTLTLRKLADMNRGRTAVRGYGAAGYAAARPAVDGRG
jgi:hypothetical protein